MAEAWSGAAEMSVYLADGLSGPERAALERDLRSDASVISVEFISKETALARFRQTFPDLAQTLGGMQENPLPASLDVRLRSATGESAPIDALVTRMRTMPGVADVRYDQDWLDRLLRGVRVLRLVGVSLGGNALLKWLGEQGAAAHAVVQRAAAISAPMDLHAAGNALEQGFNMIYTNNFMLIFF